MGPERRDKLRSTDRREQARQEHDALLAESARLVAEMEFLLQRAREIQAKHLETREKMKRTPK